MGHAGMVEGIFMLIGMLFGRGLFHPFISHRLDRGSYICGTSFHFISSSFYPPASSLPPQYSTQHCFDWHIPQGQLLRRAVLRRDSHDRGHVNNGGDEGRKEESNIAYNYARKVVGQPEVKSLVSEQVK